MTKPLYRIASVLFLLFAAGHTAGVLTFRPKSEAALAVLEGMGRVRFQFGNTTGTWLGFYTGFGFFVSAYLLFSVVLAWRLGNARAEEVSMARTLAWMLFATQVVNIGLCLHYFGAVQAIFAIACAGVVGAAALQTRPASVRTAVSPA
jgi:hypothetical protein